MAEERRNRKQMPSPQTGQQWGKCVGVYEVGRGARVRKIARVLLASGFVVTAYLSAAPAPAVESDVLVAVAMDQPTGDPEFSDIDCVPGACEDRPAASHFTVVS
jgi:ribosomal protein S12